MLLSTFMQAFGVILIQTPYNVVGNKPFCVTLL